MPLAGYLDSSLSAHLPARVRTDGTIRRNKGDVMKKIAATFALIASLALTAPAKKHDSAAKTYDKQGMAIAVPTHYESVQRVDSFGGHYEWACDPAAGKLSCTDNPVPYLTYVRLAPDGPMYFALRFIDKQQMGLRQPYLTASFMKRIPILNIGITSPRQRACASYASRTRRATKRAIPSPEKLATR